MAEKGWQRRFADPVHLPDGRALLTLRDAGQFVASLPASQQRLAHWQTAAGLLTLVAEHGGDAMLPRIAMLQALNHGKVAPAIEPRRKAAKRYKIIPAAKH